MNAFTRNAFSSGHQICYCRTFDTERSLFAQCVVSRPQLGAFESILYFIRQVCHPSFCPRSSSSKERCYAKYHCIREPSF